jgi:outer membrane protein insertion porin family
VPAFALLLLALQGPLVQIDVQGELIDPPEVLADVIRTDAGREYVPESFAGPDEDTKAAQGTQARLRETLRTLGYETAFQTRPVAGGLALTIVLRPLQRIRQIFVKPLLTRFPLFEEDILRRIRFRPGFVLPGHDELSRQIDEERERIRQFLEREGYFDGEVEMFLRDTSRRAEVNLDIVLYKGSGYSLDADQPGVHFDPSSDTRVVPADAVRNVFRHDHLWERLACLWLCGEFSLDSLRDDLTTVQQKFAEAGYPGTRVTQDFSPETSLDHKRKKAHFSVIVATRRRVQVAFRGNRHISDDDLRHRLTFAQARSFDAFEADNSARSIHQEYQRQGYYEAQIDWQREELPDRNLVRVTFLIDEGPELKVRAIEFAGNHNISSEALAGVIETRVFPAIGIIGLGEGGYVTNRQVEGDEARITEYYRKHGYPFASVRGEVATEPALLGHAGALAARLLTLGPRADGDLYVRFTIDEGPLVRVGRVEVTYKGEHTTQPVAVLRLLRQRTGMPFTEVAARNDHDTIERWLKENGFRSAQVTLQTGNEASTERDVTYQIQEGVRVRFGQTLIRGNFRTSSRTILRELPWRPGQTYNESQVDQAERNLRLLGLFTTLRFRWLPAQGEPDVVHSVIEVEERYDDWGTIEPAVGFGTDLGFFGTLKYTDRNLFGWGKGIELGGTLGQYRTEVTGTYIDPHILGSRLRLEISAFRRTEQTVRLGNILTYGTSATVSRELIPRLRLLMRYELKKVTRNEALARPPGPLEDTQSIPIPTLTAGLGPTLDYDRRDNPLMPTRGYHLSTTMFYATRLVDPFQETPTYLKFNVTVTGYMPLGHGIAVYAASQYDQGVPLGGASLLPKVERFFAGGDTTVRGIEEDRLKTEVVRLPAPGAAGLPAYQLTAVGGNIRMLEKLELIFPLWRNSTLPLSTALFFDTGVITNSLDVLALRDFRHSIGIAPLRLVTPVGFFSLEYAWPLDPRVGDDPSGRFHFTFGFGI